MILCSYQLLISFVCYCHRQSGWLVAAFAALWINNKKKNFTYSRNYDKAKSIKFPRKTSKPVPTSLHVKQSFIHDKGIQWRSQKKTSLGHIPTCQLAFVNMIFLYIWEPATLTLGNLCIYIHITDTIGEKMKEKPQ